MARRRGRKMAMAAAGLATAATPLLFGQQVAGAAVTTADDEESLTFVTQGGATVTCTASVIAVHDTDNADQPRLEWNTSLTGDAECFDDFLTFVTATYNDSEGVTRTATFSASGATGGGVTGAYTATSVSANVNFRNCDSTQSTSCEVTMTASPK
jgi:hypothetical protein